jgi:phenylalanyl-tRNA synthetase beta chain
MVSYADSYEKKQKEVHIPFESEKINTLNGKKYTEKEVQTILNNLGIQILPSPGRGGIEGGVLSIPFWRKDLNNIADIAEEIARIDGYDKIESTIPKINLGAVIQDIPYKIKKDARNFFTQQ